MPRYKDFGIGTNGKQEFSVAASCCTSEIVAHSEGIDTDSYNVIVRYDGTSDGNAITNHFYSVVLSIGLVTAFYGGF